MKVLQLCCLTMMILCISCVQVSATEMQHQVYNVEMSPYHSKNLFELPIFMRILHGYEMVKTKFGVADKNKKIEFEACEIKDTFDNVVDFFRSEKMKKEGCSIKADHSFLWNGRKTSLFKVFHNTEGKKTSLRIAKWILLTDMGKNTWMISGSYDAKNQKRASDVLSMIKTIYIADDSSLTENMTVSVDSAKYGLSPTAVSNRVLVYTKDGKLPTEAPDQTVFVITKMKNKSIFNNTQKIEFVSTQFEAMNGGKKCNIISTSDVTVDFMTGTEYIATCENSRCTERGVSYMMLLLSGCDIYLLTGMSENNGVENSVLFHNLAMTFKRVKVATKGL